MFSFLLEASIINSHIIYSTSHRPQQKFRSMSQLNYRLNLCSSLTKGNVSRKRRASQQEPSTTGARTPNLLEHELIRMFGQKGVCHWCSKTKKFSKRGRPHETVYGCNLCKIRLWKGECYSQYHQTCSDVALL